MKTRFGVSKPYWNTMRAPWWPEYDSLVQTDLANLDPNYAADVQRRHNHNPSYHPSMLNVARHVAPGIESVTGSYSQSMQDIFVLTLLNGRRNGVYLELGATFPINFNNTYLLSSEFNWRGISVEIVDLTQEWKDLRPNDIFVRSDAFLIDYPKLFEQYQIPERIDYFQMDIDDIRQHQLLETLLNTGRRFSVITYEHDVFRGDTTEKDRSTDLLNKHGYVKLIENITCLDFSTDEHVAFEDWWIDPTDVDSKIQEKFLTLNKDKVYPFELFCRTKTVDNLVDAVLAQKNIWDCR